jgi:hypothetical protein
MSDPTPYRNPLGWWQPTIRGGNGGASGPISVEVAIPNEDPDTEDDITLVFTFTGEGLMIDAFVSDGQEIDAFGQSYEEVFERIFGGES